MSPDQPQEPQGPQQSGQSPYPTELRQPYQPLVPGQTAQYPPQPQPLPTQPSNYDFIMNSGQPSKTKGFKLPGGGTNGLAVRIGIVAGGLIVLVILFAVINSIVVKGPDLTGYISVAQDQQEIIHLVTNTSNSQNLSDDNENSVATLNAVITSNQAKVLTYIKSQGQKITAKQLSLKLDASLDKELTDSQTAGTYDSTFENIIKGELSVYTKDLASTYQKASGPNGRLLLQSLYKQAELMQPQTASSSTSN